MLDANSIGLVLDVLRPERQALVALLTGLDPAQWELSTECPLYSVKGVALHVLGNDLSLLSRQRDRAENGLRQIAGEMPGTDFRTLLDTFNDRWVAAARFFSTELVVELLRITGEWTAAYYDALDPCGSGEPVGFFGVRGTSSPWWQAIAREYVERWVHHSQIRRAIGLGALADVRFLRVGVEVIAAAARVEEHVPDEPDGSWALGDIDLGRAQQTADILTRAFSADEVRARITGPADAVTHLATLTARPGG